MLNLADLIMGLPLQIEIEIGSVKYLLAHAMTFDPTHGVQEETLYLEGIEEMQEYWKYGVKGYVSLVGHHDKFDHQQDLCYRFQHAQLLSFYRTSPSLPGTYQEEYYQMCPTSSTLLLLHLLLHEQISDFLIQNMKASAESTKSVSHDWKESSELLLC